MALWLVAGPLTGIAPAATEHGDTHAGHDMGTMDHSDQTGGHNMNQTDGVNMDKTSQDSHGGHDAGSSEDHGSTEGGYESDGGHGGHGGAAQDPNTPPNWSVIYGFGAFNVLVILAAALLKGKSIGGE
ncbi:MAG: hypothetical protein ACOY35_03325 [Bacillota bacterium]